MFKRSVVIKAKRIKPLKWDYETIIMFTLFLCGVILGIFIIKNSGDEFRCFLNNCIGNYISSKSQNGFIVCFCGLLLFLLVFVFTDFLFGLCAVGTPLVWLIPVVFGVMCGGCVSCMFINYGLKGLFYCLLVDLICFAITAATLIKCCRESTNMSVDLFTCIMGNSCCKNAISFKEYVISYLVLCIPVVLSALISTVCFKLFAGLFIFA